MPELTGSAVVGVDDRLTALVVTAAEVVLAVVLLRAGLALALAAVARAAELHRPGSDLAGRLRLTALRLGPRAARTAVAAVAGVGLVASVTTAAHASGARPTAQVPVLDRVVVAPDLLSDVVLGGTHGWRDGAAHRVRPGDTLWSVAEHHLRESEQPRRADDPVAVDRAWRRWYAANRQVVGPDPAALRPGQLLTPPPAR